MLFFALALLTQGAPAAPATPLDPSADSAGPAEGDSRPAFYPVNQLDLIVNDRCLTRRDVEREIWSQERPATEEEQAALINKIINARVEELLKTQAGKDLGFDPNMVQRLVENELDRREELAGSASLLGDQLVAQKTDSGTYYESTESMILAELWKRSVEGRFPGPGGRPYVDRYVRPGRLLFEYERNKGQLALPATVTLQELALDAQKIGDLGEAKDMADELRERIELGEDFGEVALSAGAAQRDTRGVLPPYEEERMMKIPGLDGFLPGAEVGDVSEVLPVRTSDGVLRGFRVVKLLARERPEPPAFQNQAFQQKLTEHIRESLDRGRADAALSRLLKAAYVWPPEAFGRPEPGVPNPLQTTPPSGAPNPPNRPGGGGL